MLLPVLCWAILQPPTPQLNHSFGAMSQEVKTGTNLGHSYI